MNLTAISIPDDRRLALIRAVVTGVVVLTLLAAFTYGVIAARRISSAAIYVGSDNGILTAINQATGGTIWKWYFFNRHAYPQTYVYVSPIVVGRGVVVVGVAVRSIHRSPLPGPPLASTLIGLDASSGLQLWRVDDEQEEPGTIADDDDLDEEPSLIAGHLLIDASSNRGIVTARDLATGAIRWQVQPMPHGFINDILMGNTLYLFAGTNAPTIIVTALNLTSGIVVWTHTLANERIVSATGAGGSLIIRAADRLIVLQTVNGATEWRTTPSDDCMQSGGLGGEYCSPPIIGTNAVLYSIQPPSKNIRGERTTTLFARSLTDGTLLWQQTLPKSADFIGATSDAALLVTRTISFTIPDHIMALNENTGVQQWSMRNATSVMSTITGGFEVSGNTLIIEGIQDILSVDVLTGAVRWHQKFVDQQSADGFDALIFTKGQIIVSYGSTIIALQTTSGTISWTRSFPNLFSSILIAAY